MTMIALQYRRETRPSFGPSCCGRINASPHPFPNSSKVRWRQGGRRFVGRLHQPRLQIGCHAEGPHFLVADGAKNIVDKVACIRAGAFTQLPLEEFFHVFGQGNCHFIGFKINPAVGDFKLEAAKPRQIE